MNPTPKDARYYDLLDEYCKLSGPELFAIHHITLTGWVWEDNATYYRMIAMRNAMTKMGMHSLRSKARAAFVEKYDAECAKREARYKNP